MAFVATASSLPSDFGIFKNPCLSEGLCFPISHGCNSIKSRIDGPRVHDLSTTRCKGPFLGTPRFLWPSMGNGFYLSKVCVAADPSSRLSSAELARTTVQANKDALLVFRGMVPREPHEQISWAVLQYGVDDSGDISFKISDDANPSKDRWTYKPVAIQLSCGAMASQKCKSYICGSENAFFGMDIPMYLNKRNSESTIFEEIPFEDSEMEVFNTPVNWDLPVNGHPINTSKNLAKAVDNNMEYDKRLNHPSNCVSILGYLIPANVDKRFRVRLDHPRTKEIELSPNPKDTNLKRYQLEIEKITLHTVYGSQNRISVVEFRNAKPDILVHSASEILDLLNRNCSRALEDFCKKKALGAKGAHVIGVDSLGMDVRVLKGRQVKTHSIPFKPARATSRNEAVKLILQLLFPQTWRRWFYLHYIE